MRQYEKIWIEIKKLPVGKKLPIRVHASAVKRVKQAVKLEKTKEVAVKKKLDMLTEGPLVISVTEDTVRHDPDFAIIYFSLEWDGTKL